MPLILGTNSIKDTGFNVANSCRFSGGNDYLRTNGFGTPTSSRKMTLSFWCKRSGFAGNDRILTADTSGSNNNRDSILFSSNTLNIFLDNAVPGHLKTNRLFRDASAWYHIVIAIDTTQSTDTNRIKIYVNGVQETSFDSSGDGIVYPSQNYDLLGFGQNRENTIGADSTNGGDNDFLDGYLAEYCFIDGQQLDPTSFGEFDEDTGIWKPIDVSGLTFGNNGFYLDFENSGSLGADVSGNGNNFTVNHLTSIDQTTATCTNNFATWNPLASSSQATLSEGNLKAVGNSTDDGNVFCNMVPKSGKWYAEFKITKSNDGIPTIGIRQESSGFRLLNGTSGAVGYYQYEASVRPDGQRYTNNSTASWGGSTFITGSIVGIALDCDNGAGYISVNGTYMNSGDPTSGASKTGAFITWTEAQAEYGGQTFASRIYTTSSGIEANFGSPPYSESGGNSDGNGYGNFAGSVPSGYYALNTKNLAEYG